MSDALLLAAGNPLNHVVQHPWIELGRTGDISWTLLSNHIFMQLVAAGLLCWLLPRFVQQRAGGDEVNKLVPTGAGNAIEALCVGLRDGIFRPNLGEYTDLFTPYLWSTFFFIFTCNILGMIPLADVLYFVPGHLGGTSTGNFWVTGTLAICTLVLIVYNGLKYHGVEYIKHFFMGPWWLSWFIAILELFGLLFKTMALCVRLTANMLAGHILLAVLLGFVGAAYAALGVVGGTAITVGVVLLSIAFYFLEIFVAFLHAFIFTVLTAVFIGQAVNIHHDEHHEEHAHGDAPGHAGSEPVGAAAMSHG